MLHWGTITTNDDLRQRVLLEFMLAQVEIPQPRDNRAILITIQSAVLSAISTRIITWDMNAQKGAHCKLLRQHHLYGIFGSSPLVSPAGEYLNVSFILFTTHVSFGDSVAHQYNIPQLISYLHTENERIPNKRTLKCISTSIRKKKTVKK